MAFYGHDRFNNFGFTMMATANDGIVLTADPAPERKVVAEQNVYSKSTLISPLLMSYVSASKPVANASAPTEQQKAEEELDALNKQLQEAETAAVVQETLDLGPPPSTPWLLYAGIGVGAVALIGGALFLTKKKGKKVGGHRRRR